MNYSFSFAKKTIKTINFLLNFTNSNNFYKINNNSSKLSFKDFYGFNIFLFFNSRQFLKSIFILISWLKVRVLYYINNWVYTTNHKRIAVNYFWFVILSGIVGMVLATVIRLELAYPGVGIFAGDSLQYLSLVSAHGVIMVFFMIMPLLFGAFANFLLPTQLGVHDVAFPRLNSAAFWFLPAGLIMLAQLVCVDRRYQRMNCFNIREIQSLLKRRFFTDLINTNDHRTLLNETVMGLRFKTNNLNSVNPNMFVFYNYGLELNAKNRSNYYTILNSEFNTFYLNFVNFEILKKFSLSNPLNSFNLIFLNFFSNFLFLNNLTLITQSLTSSLFFFVHLFNSFVHNQFFLIINYFFSILPSFTNLSLTNNNPSYRPTYEFNTNLIVTYGLYFFEKLLVNIIDLLLTFYFFVFNLINSFLKIFIFTLFDIFFNLFQLNFFKNINMNSNLAIDFKIFTEELLLIKDMFLEFTGLYNLTFFFNNNNELETPNEVNFNLNNNSFNNEFLSLTLNNNVNFEKINYSNQLDLNLNYKLNSFYNYTTFLQNIKIQKLTFIINVLNESIASLLSYFYNYFLILNSDELENLTKIYLKYFIFVIKPMWQEINLFNTSYPFNVHFNSELNQSNELSFNFFLNNLNNLNNFNFSLIKIWILNIKNIIFDMSISLLTYLSILIFNLKPFFIFEFFYNFINFNKQYLITGINLFFGNSYKSLYFTNLTSGSEFNLLNEETSSSSMRYHRFDNPVFKYDYKSGDYFPKVYGVLYSHLINSALDVTSGLRTSPWFFASNFSEVFNNNFDNFADNIIKINAKNSLLHGWTGSRFNATYGFYNFFYTLMLENYLINERWVSVNSLNQKFYRMFNTSSMQQRIYSNWRQLKFTREAWRCKLLSARHQKTLYRRYVNEDGVFWSIERNAKDLLPGWAMITPFSSRTRFTAIGKVDIGLMGVLLVLNSSIISGANFLVTYRYLSTLNNRKMRDARSFFTEAIMVSSWMMIFANPMLVIGIIMLLSDRHWQTSFFDYSGGGDTVLFQHMFWFFGHPEVYIIIIPTFGFTNTILSYYLKKRISARASLMYSMYTIAFLGFFVWGHHMYMVGLAHTTRMLFSTLTVMISVPAATKLMHWCVTLANSAVTLELPLICTLTFVFFFVSGGISGMAVAHTGMDILFHDTFYVIGHFHVMLAGAAMIGSFGAFYFYFVAIFGVKYSRIYAYLHYVYYLLGQLFTVIPMFWLGYAGMPRRVLDYPASLGGWHSVISGGHMLSVAGLMAFFIMIFDSLRQAKAVTRNTFGIGRYNTRLNFYIYEIARLVYVQKRGWALFKANHAYSLKLNGLNYKNLEYLETTLFSYTFTKTI